MSEHGSRGSYVRGCHCDACTAANTLYIRRWRHHGRADIPRAFGAPFKDRGPLECTMTLDEWKMARGVA